MKRILLASILTLALLSTSACTRWKPSYGQPTFGQKMIDLKEARDRGALTEDEYQQIKGMHIDLVRSHGDWFQNKDGETCPHAKEEKSKSCSCQKKGFTSGNSKPSHKH